MGAKMTAGEAVALAERYLDAAAAVVQQVDMTLNVPNTIPPPVGTLELGLLQAQVGRGYAQLATALTIAEVGVPYRGPA